jgi:hypothetical protein
MRGRAIPLLCTLLATSCDPGPAQAVLDNDYPPLPARPYVVYAAFWQAVSFTAPVLPGAASAPLQTVSASANTAYVLVAPDWDPARTAPPASFLLLQSREDYGVQLGDVLHIAIDDDTFAGNCDAGSSLTQAQADFMAQRVFPGELAGRSYDAGTCTLGGGSP